MGYFPGYFYVRNVLGRLQLQSGYLRMGYVPGYFYVIHVFERRQLQSGYLRMERMCMYFLFVNVFIFRIFRILLIHGTMHGLPFRSVHGGNWRICPRRKPMPRYVCSVCVFVGSVQVSFFSGSGVSSILVRPRGGPRGVRGVKGVKKTSNTHAKYLTQEKHQNHRMRSRQILVHNCSYVMSR